MALLTLQTAKDNLALLSNNVICNSFVLRDCYQVGETIYSIMYDKIDDIYYTIDPDDQSLVEV